MKGLTLCVLVSLFASGSAMNVGESTLRALYAAHRARFNEPVPKAELQAFLEKKLKEDPPAGKDLAEVKEMIAAIKAESSSSSVQELKAPAVKEDEPAQADIAAYLEKKLKEDPPAGKDLAEVKSMIESLKAEGVAGKKPATAAVPAPVAHQKADEPMSNMGAYLDQMIKNDPPADADLAEVKSMIAALKTNRAAEGDSSTPTPPPAAAPANTASALSEHAQMTQLISAYAADNIPAASKPVSKDQQMSQLIKGFFDDSESAKADLEAKAKRDQQQMPTGLEDSLN